MFEKISYFKMKILFYINIELLIFVGNIFQARQGSNDKTFDHERKKFTGQSHFEGVGIPEGWDVWHDRNVFVASPQQRRQIILELPGV